MTYSLKTKPYRGRPGTAAAQGSCCRDSCIAVGIPVKVSFGRALLLVAATHDRAQGDKPELPSGQVIEDRRDLDGTHF